jgi:dephospho-CoA kinase
MIIIGITGTLGAGKGTIVDFLINKKGYRHFSVRAFITDEIKKRNMPVNRDSMVIVANELRAKYHPGYIVEQLYNQALEAGSNCIIESIRATGEADLLKSRGMFYLISVDADPAVRYDRIVIRANETDHISFKEFLENEKREMLSNDPNKQNNSIAELNQHVEIILKKIEEYGKPK